MRPVDWLLGGYVAFVTGLIVLRGGVGTATPWILSGHLLFFVLLVLFQRRPPLGRLGGTLHDLYPLILLMPFYTELGFLGMEHGAERIFANDAVVQGWEQWLFGSQISYEWIRHAPSVFWSSVLHLSYLSYYPLVVVGPILLTIRGQRPEARRVLFTTMVAYVTCYVVFLSFPVAGPNYAFQHPTGPVRDVWSAVAVYAVLGGGSSIGTAFPSSHVAATLAAVFALWDEWRSLGAALTVPAALLVVATVYCQMHYGIDALAGIAVAVGAAIAGHRIRRHSRGSTTSLAF